MPHKATSSREESARRLSKELSTEHAAIDKLRSELAAAHTALAAAQVDARQTVVELDRARNREASLQTDVCLRSVPVLF